MFYFELAAHLGMTVRQLLKSITSYEIEEWKCFFTIRAERAEVEQRDARVIQSLSQRQRTMGTR